jgi:hypothetical protein
LPNRAPKLSPLLTVAYLLAGSAFGTVGMAAFDLMGFPKMLVDELLGFNENSDVVLGLAAGAIPASGNTFNFYGFTYFLSAGSLGFWPRDGV